MAYPGEPEHLEYLKYVEDQQVNGQSFLPKEEWRRTMASAPTAPEPQSGQKSVVEAILDKLRKR